MTLGAILSALACFAFLPQMQATPQVVPAPDGCYPGFTTAEGCNALQFLGAGAGNTGIGWYSLYSAGAANYNTGVGAGTLVLNTAESNTAVGAAALLLNTSGDNGVAVGTDALVYNDSGDDNTAVGFQAMEFNVAGFTNVAVGTFAAQNNDSSGNGTAVFNTAVGGFALQANVDGTQNTVVGAGALETGGGGSNNTMIGFLAGNSITGDSNTFIGSQAGANEGPDVDNVICLGTPGDTQAAGQITPNRCYIGNIVGVSTGGPAPSVPVIIDQDGQLGTVVSSRRFKQDIKPINQTSEAILKLKPVTFHYKNRDVKNDLTPQFGLIAEDVEQVNRDLVVYGKDGQVLSVRYDAVNAMLLNEFLKEHKKVEKQQASIADLKSTVALQRKEMQVLTAQLKEQAAQIQKVSVQIEMGQPATKVVSNKP